MKKLSLTLFCCLLVAMTAWAQDRAMSPFGYCGTSVTGGGNATPTLVSTLSEFQSATAKGTTPRVVIITHDIEFNSLYTIQDTQNLTILALPGVKLFSNEQNKDYSGILYFKRCSNIILRNITFVGPGAYDCDGNDCLCFQDVTYSWVDHCDFQDGCDGNFDNKNGTDNVTVSWCRFRYLKDPKAGGSGGSNDHRYTNLLGSSETDKPADGTYNMTWAYCWWDEGCKERMLRCRNASLHFLGCYWNSSVANYYIGPQNADAYIELCTFEGKPATDHIFYQNYGGTNGATFVNSVATKGLPANVSNRQVLVPTYSYPKYSSAAESKEAVMEYAGATLYVDEQGNVSGTNTATNTPVINVDLESSATAYVGKSKTLSATFKYAESYQWYKNTNASNTGGTPISEATSSSYTFTPSATGTYYYYCVATNSQAMGIKSVASAVCTVTVSEAPTMWTAATATYNSTSKGYEVAGVGTYYKSTSGGTTTLDNQDTSADWAAGKNYVVTSSSLFIFSPQVTVSGLKLYVKGTGSRTMSSVKVASSLSDSYNDLSYDAISTCSDSRYVATNSERSIITLTFNSTVDANKFIQITLSGNVNVYGIEPIESSVTPQPTLYTVTYNANGHGTCSTSNWTQASEGQSTTLPSVTANTGYRFMGWATSSVAVIAEYNAGASYTPTSDVTLYAVYQQEQQGGGEEGDVATLFSWESTNNTVEGVTVTGGTATGTFAPTNGLYAMKLADKPSSLTDGNHVIVTLSNGITFAEGDVITVTGFYSKNSNTETSFGVVPGSETNKAILGTETDWPNNYGRNYGEDGFTQVTHSYTLTSDFDNLTTILLTRGSKSGTALCLTKVEVTREDSSLPATVTATVASTRKFGSFSSLYNIDFGTDENAAVQAYTVKVKDATSVVLTRHYGVLPAGQGVVLYAPGTTKSQTFNVAASATALVNDNDMIGVPVAKTVEVDVDGKHAYVVNSDAFKPLSVSGTIAAGKAYIRIPSSLGGAKAISMMFNDDNATGISNYDFFNTNTSVNKIYNLQGIEVKNPIRGRIYIINNKKCIFK